MQDQNIQDFINDLMLKKGTQSVRVKQSLYAKAKQICEDQYDNLSVNDYINAALANAILKDLS